MSNSPETELVQIGWRYRHDPDNWAVRNLMRTDPVPVEDWEPVYVYRDDDPEYEGYWNRIRDLEARITALEAEKKEALSQQQKKSNSARKATKATGPKSPTSKGSSSKETK